MEPPLEQRTKHGPINSYKLFSIIGEQENKKKKGIIIHKLTIFLFSNEKLLKININ